LAGRQPPASDPLIPDRTELLAGYPNPFRGSAVIPFQIGKDVLKSEQLVPASVTIFDNAGRCVRRMDLGLVAGGCFNTKDLALAWDGRDDSGRRLPSGIYLYRLQAGEYSAVRRFTLVR
jgi:hypothetical protein